VLRTLVPTVALHHVVDLFPLLRVTLLLRCVVTRALLRTRLYVVGCTRYVVVVVALFCLTLHLCLPFMLPIVTLCLVTLRCYVCYCVTVTLLRACCCCFVRLRCRCFVDVIYVRLRLRCRCDLFAFTLRVVVVVRYVVVVVYVAVMFVVTVLRCYAFALRFTVASLLPHMRLYVAARLSSLPLRYDVCCRCCRCTLRRALLRCSLIYVTVLLHVRVVTLRVVCPHTIVAFARLRVRLPVWLCLILRCGRLRFAFVRLRLQLMHVTAFWLRLLRFVRLIFAFTLFTLQHCITLICPVLTPLRYAIVCCCLRLLRCSPPLLRVDTRPLRCLRSLPRLPFVIVRCCCDR